MVVPGVVAVPTTTDDNGKDEDEPRPVRLVFRRIARAKRPTVCAPLLPLPPCDDDKDDASPTKTVSEPPSSFPLQGDADDLVDVPVPLLEFCCRVVCRCRSVEQSNHQKFVFVLCQSLLP